MPYSDTTGFSCKKFDFLELITNGDIGKQLFSRIKLKYMNDLRKPLYEHRLY